MWSSGISLLRMELQLCSQMGFGNEASSHSKVPHWGKEEEGMHLAWEALK